MAATLDLSQNRTAQGWSLVAHNDGDTVAIRTFPCQIGRQPGLAVRIVHPTVSLKHAELSLAGDGLSLKDLGSRNGTFVNGTRVVGEQPVRAGDLVQFGAAVFRLHNKPPEDVSVTCQSEDMGDLALALAQFDKLINCDCFVPHYQPIVQAANDQPVAYEALARSCLFGLEKPNMMFRAAEYFQMEAELSRLFRKQSLGLSTAMQIPHLFLNTHPTELRDIKQMIMSLVEIRKSRPQQKMTLEVHEAAAVDIGTMKMLRLVLNDLGMGLAYDDFGAGQARLHELVEAKPNVLKFDRQLITGIDRAGAHRQQLVKSLVQLSRQLGITTLAEGVETATEAEFCRGNGFELLQGFYFGRPESELTCNHWTSDKNQPEGT